MADTDPWEKAQDPWEQHAAPAAAPNTFQRVARAATEANPLSMRQLPPEGTAAPTWAGTFQGVKEALVPGPGHLGGGNPLDLVHAIPLVGPSLANLLSEMNPEQWPEALGHMIGVGAQGGPQALGEGAAPPAAMEPRPAGAGIGRTLARGALKVAAEPEVGVVTGAGIGSALGHPVIGAMLGRAMSAHANKLLGRLQEQLGTEVPDAPTAETMAIPEMYRPNLAQPKPSAITPGEAPPAARPDWRQEIVTELNKKPGNVAQPKNTVTSPETAPAGPEISGREAANRSKLAQDMAQFLHSNGQGISYEDALRMGPDQWKLARTAVRQTGKATTPSPATIQLALEHLQDIQKTTPIRAATPAAAAEAGSHLSGRSLELARQMAEAIGQ
jgi:hypothetical protein